MNAIYYDMVDVKEDIKSFVNIEKYGDLHYKKMTLSEHSRQLFHQNDIKNFHRVTDKKELSSLIELINYSDHSDYLFISSNLAIVNKEAFAHFLKKIKYVESSLTVCDCDCIRPLLKFSKSEAVDFLKLMMSDNCTLHQAIENKANSFERFSQECFYLEIKNYKDFVTYLQNDFELRYFNSIKSTRHVLTKKSSQKEKMLKEFTYYSVLPDEMKIFFLPPFNFKEHKEHAEYSMERLNILDVSLQWIHFSMNQDEFRKLLENLFFFLNNRWEKEAGKQELKTTLENLYLKKLDERAKAFSQTPIYDYVNEIIANSTSYKNFEEIIGQYKELYANIVNTNNYQWMPVISHGDLCFSNILYDKRIDFLKLIDPKGCLKEEEAYLDALYDVAKLSHSILGNYDFINNGIFDVKYDNQLKIKLELPDKNGLADKKKMFREYLDKYEFPYKLVRLYEASLFLSMIPLHIDYPKKVLAFILTGVNILEELKQK